MNAETLVTISTVFFIIAAIFMLLTIFLWVFLKIPSVLADMTGKTAQKSIAQMRESNEKSGQKAYRTSETNLSRGKLTEPIANDGWTANDSSMPESYRKPQSGNMADANSAYAYNNAADSLGLDKEKRNTSNKLDDYLESLTSNNGPASTKDGKSEDAFHEYFAKPTNEYAEEAPMRRLDGFGPNVTDSNAAAANASYGSSAAASAARKLQWFDQQWFEQEQEQTTELSTSEPEKSEYKAAYDNKDGANNAQRPYGAFASGGAKLKILEEVLLIHTDEVI